MDYPQAPPMDSPEVAEELFESQTIAVLCSHNPDGSIHASPTYFLYEEGTFFMGTQVPSRKVRNLQRNPTASLLVEKRTSPFQSVLAYGTAEVVTGDVMERRLQILDRRMEPADAREFADWLASGYGLAEIRLRPERTVTIDYRDWRVLID